ncbi:hypothetical protein CRUP_028983 [Coryphaenoides rupestris]|nr:hypothetical protein CRUP_028983 [Coryphaenoides rupestris]
MAELRGHRNEVFSREQGRQRALYPRIEKIEVRVSGPGLDGSTLIMNKGLSTPLSCAKPQKLIHEDLAWEPLEVVPPVALEVFSHSRFKQEEVEKMAAESQNGTVTLYRCGDHVLLSAGPLVARTGLCNQYEVTAIHSLQPGPLGLQRRVQGLSLPLQLQGHHTVWRKLRARAVRPVGVSNTPKTTAPPTDQSSPTSPPPPTDQSSPTSPPPPTDQSSPTSPPPPTDQSSPTSPSEPETTPTPSSPTPRDNRWRDGET